MDKKAAAGPNVSQEWNAHPAGNFRERLAQFVKYNCGEGYRPPGKIELSDFRDYSNYLRCEPLLQSWSSGEICEVLASFRAVLLRKGVVDKRAKQAGGLAMLQTLAQACVMRRVGVVPFSSKERQADNFVLECMKRLESGEVPRPDKDVFSRNIRSTQFLLDEYYRNDRLFEGFNPRKSPTGPVTKVKATIAPVAHLSGGGLRCFHKALTDLVGERLDDAERFLAEDDRPAVGVAMEDAANALRMALLFRARKTRDFPCQEKRERAAAAAALENAAAALETALINRARKPWRANVPAAGQTGAAEPLLKDNVRRLAFAALESVSNVLDEARAISAQELSPTTPAAERSGKAEDLPGDCVWRTVRATLQTAIIALKDLAIISAWQESTVERPHAGDWRAAVTARRKAVSELETAWIDCARLARISKRLDKKEVRALITALTGAAVGMESVLASRAKKPTQADLTLEQEKGEKRFRDVRDRRAATAALQDALIVLRGSLIARAKTPCASDDSDEEDFWTVTAALWNARRALKMVSTARPRKPLPTDPAAALFMYEQDLRVAIAALEDASIALRDSRIIRAWKAHTPGHLAEEEGLAVVAALRTASNGLETALLNRVRAQNPSPAAPAAGRPEDAGLLLDEQDRRAVIMALQDAFMALNASLVTRAKKPQVPEHLDEEEGLGGIAAMQESLNNRNSTASVSEHLDEEDMRTVTVALQNAVFANEMAAAILKRNSSRTDSAPARPENAGRFLDAQDMQPVIKALEGAAAVLKKVLSHSAQKPSLRSGYARYDENLANALDNDRSKLNARTARTRHASEEDKDFRRQAIDALAIRIWSESVKTPVGKVAKDLLRLFEQVEPIRAQSTPGKGVMDRLHAPPRPMEVYRDALVEASYLRSYYTRFHPDTLAPLRTKAPCQAAGLYLQCKAARIVDAKDRGGPTPSSAYQELDLYVALQFPSIDARPTLAHLDDYLVTNKVQLREYLEDMLKCLAITTGGGQRPAKGLGDGPTGLSADKDALGGSRGRLETKLGKVLSYLSTDNDLFIRRRGQVKKDLEDVRKRLPDDDHSVPVLVLRGALEGALECLSSSNNKVLEERRAQLQRVSEKVLQCLSNVKDDHFVSGRKEFREDLREALKRLSSTGDYALVHDRKKLCERLEKWLDKLSRANDEDRVKGNQSLRDVLDKLLEQLSIMNDAALPPFWQWLVILYETPDPKRKLEQLEQLSVLEKAILSPFLGHFLHKHPEAMLEEAFRLIKAEADRAARELEILQSMGNKWPLVRKPGPEKKHPKKLGRGAGRPRSPEF